MASLGIQEEIPLRIRYVVFVEPLTKMFRKQLGHVYGSGTVIALWGCFLPGFVVESHEDVNLLPFKVEAHQFQGGHFADTQAAKGCDQAHEFERLPGSVDDSRRRICIEEENLCLGRLVSGELNVSPSDIGDEIAPLSALVQN